MEEGTLVGSFTKKLVAIWMAMAPLPVAILLAAVIAMELAIISVPFAKVYAIGTVFAVIPLMIVMMVAIIVARMIHSDLYFLGRARLGRRRSSECCRQKQKTQISSCYVHLCSSVNRELQDWNSGL